MGPGNDVGADHLTDAHGGGLTGLHGGLHRPHVPLDEDGDQTGADLLLAHQGHVGALQHGVGGLDGGGEAVGLDHAQGGVYRHLLPGVLGALAHGGPLGGHDPGQVGVGPGDDVDAEQLAHPGGGLLAGVGGGLHRAHLAGDDDGGQAGADGVGADELHVGGLQHGVGGLDIAHQTLGLNKT